ncbi:MAG: hypothetical protein LBG58_00420, partial [Planctomycetaceae bacterium]|nr:hypothetical protein [Planctomycetaceae bacterium]
MRFAVALVLLVAAMLKAYQLATTPTLGESLLHARWFNIFVVEFELFFGIWLFFGLLPKLTHWMSVGLFSIFLVFSFHKTISGATTCGCWGNVEIPPIYTVLLDVFVIGLLIVFRPHTRRFHSFSNVKYWSGVKYQIINYFLIVIPLG